MLTDTSVTLAQACCYDTESALRSEERRGTSHKLTHQAESTWRACNILYGLGTYCSSPGHESNMSDMDSLFYYFVFHFSQFTSNSKLYLISCPVPAGKSSGLHFLVRICVDLLGLCRAVVSAPSHTQSSPLFLLVELLDFLNTAFSCLPPCWVLLVISQRSTTII